MHDLFTPYGTALACIAALAGMNALQGLIGGGLKNGIEGQPAGQPVAGDHKRFSFRAVRTFLNGVENLPAFFAAVFAAVLVGANAGWLNGICVAVLVSRLAYWVVYYAGIGGGGFGLRSILYCFVPIGAIVISGLAILRVLTF